MAVVSLRKPAQVIIRGGCSAHGDPIMDSVRHTYTEESYPEEYSTLESYDSPDSSFSIGLRRDDVAPVEMMILEQLQRG